MEATFVEMLTMAAREQLRWLSAAAADAAFFNNGRKACQQQTSLDDIIGLTKKWCMPYNHRLKAMMLHTLTRWAVMLARPDSPSG